MALLTLWLDVPSADQRRIRQLLAAAFDLRQPMMTHAQHPKVRDRVRAGVERRPAVDVMNRQPLGCAAAFDLAAVPGCLERRLPGSPPSCAVALRALRL